MAKAAELQAVLALKTDKFTSGMKRAQADAERGFSKIRTSAESVKSAFLAIKGLAVGLGVGLFLKSSVDEFLKAEQSSRNLQVAIEQQGGSWERLRGQFENFAKARQKTTVFGDEESLDAATRYINATGDVANALERVKLGQDIAAGSGKGLEEIMIALAQAQNGFVRPLGMMVPSIKALTEEERSWSEVQAILLKQFGGMAEATSQTSEGKVRRMANAWGDFKESLGSFVANASPALEGLTKIIEKMTEFLDVSNDAKVAALNTSIANLGITKELGWEAKVNYLEIERDTILDLADANDRLAKSRRSASSAGGSRGADAGGGGVVDNTDPWQYPLNNEGMIGPFEPIIEAAPEAVEAIEVVKEHITTLADLATGVLSPAFADFFQQLTIDAKDPHIFKDLADGIIGQLRRIMAEALALEALFFLLGFLPGGAGLKSAFGFRMIPGFGNAPGMSSMPGGGGGAVIENKIIIDGVEMKRWIRAQDEKDRRRGVG